MIDRSKFFEGVRHTPFPDTLTPGQVSGMTAILDEWDRRKLTDTRDLAYMLGTTKWETQHTMQPIREKGSNQYLRMNYDVTGNRPALAKRMGNLTPGDGILYCGRGYVQLTWKKNYALLTTALQTAGIAMDLVKTPDLALRYDVAAFVLFEGMIRGLFTGQKLNDHFRPGVTDWIGARKIINGTDKAVEIATIAKQFYADIALAS